MIDKNGEIYEVRVDFLIKEDKLEVKEYYMKLREVTTETRQDALFYKERAERFEREIADLERKLAAAREALAIARKEIVTLTVGATERIRDLGGQCDDAKKTYQISFKRIDAALTETGEQEKTELK